MRHRTPKVRSLRIHAKRRLYERYGISTNREGLSELVKIIQSNRASFVERQSLRISVFDVPWRGRVIRVVYDRNRKEIVTALPKDGQPVAESVVSKE